MSPKHSYLIALGALLIVTLACGGASSAPTATPLPTPDTQATVEAAVPANYLVNLGQDLMGPYLLPFEVASVLLLVAMIGAILIARER